MKKIFFPLFLLAFAGKTFTQCVIDTNNYNLFSPPPDELPCMERNVPYQVVLQLFCPPGLNGISVDSIRITLFSGFPVGIGAVCNTPTCSIMGGNHACITISGTTADTVGEYSMFYDGYIYTSIGTAPFSFIRTNYPGMLPDYYFYVIDSGAFCVNTDSVPTSIHEGTQHAELFSVAPNPSNGIFEVKLRSVNNEGGEISVVDLTGRKIYAQQIIAPAFYSSAINLSAFPKGIYVVQYRTASNFGSKKILVE